MLHQWPRWDLNKLPTSLSTLTFAENLRKKASVDFLCSPADPYVLMSGLGASHWYQLYRKPGGYEKGVRRAVRAGQDRHKKYSASGRCKFYLKRNRAWS